MRAEKVLDKAQALRGTRCSQHTALLGNDVHPSYHTLAFGGGVIICVSSLTPQKAPTTYPGSPGLSLLEREGICPDEGDGGQQRCQDPGAMQAPQPSTLTTTKCTQLRPAGCYTARPFQAAQPLSDTRQAGAGPEGNIPEV